MHAGGRPKIWEGKKLKDICDKLEEYIDKNPVPIVAEFAYQNDIRKATLYEQPEFAYLIKRLCEKKEANLERLAMANKTNTTFAIFSLKQLGWTDKQEIHNTGELSIIDVLNQAHKKNSDE